MVQDFVYRILAAWLPRELRRSAGEELRRARLTLCVSVLHMAASLVWAMLELTLGSAGAVPWALASTLLGMGVALLVRRSGCVVVAARCQLALGIGAVACAGFFSPELSGVEPYLVMGTVPILATALLGCREGASWTLGAIACMTLVLLFTPEAGGFGPDLAPGATTRTGWIALVGLGTTVLVLSALLETLRSSAVEELADANAELIAAQEAAAAAVQVKARFLSNMSHEIRTPMNSVISTTDLLARSDLPAELRDLSATACQGALSLLSLFHQLLSATLDAADQEAERVPCDLPEIVYGVARSFGLRTGESPWVMVVDYALDAPKCFLGDPLRIRQVLLNLVGNAAKFTPSGHIRIRIQGLPESGRVRIEVEDTGIGVAEDQRERIFQRFTQADASTTRRYGGAGLGLSISRELVRSMGGEIGVVSSLGHGSVFWFELPAEGSQGPIHTRIPRDSAYVLLVEPHVVSRNALEAQLRGLGLGFRSFEDPQAALTATDGGSPRDAEPPLAVVMAHDPPRVDAIAWLERRSRSDLPVVVVSSQACPLDATSRKRLGVQSWLLSPAPAEMLAQAIRQGATQRESEPPAFAALQGLRVLLVEDFVPNQKVARHILARLGCLADIAVNGVEALEYLTKHDYDIVLMDCQMPMMDGYEATRRFRELEEQEGRHRLPIIAVTANALPGDREQCLEAGMDDYVAKPIKLDTLRDALLRCR